MKAQKALIDFSGVKDGDLADDAQKIVDKMTGNLNYTAPQPSLSVVQSAITAYSAAVIKSKDGTKEDTANKNATRLVLQDALYTLGNYVNMTAESNLVKLESSGFSISKLPEAVGILDAPTLHVDYGKNPGELIIDIDANVNKILLDNGNEKDILLFFAGITDSFEEILFSCEKDELNTYYQQYNGFYQLMKLLEKLAFKVSEHKNKMG